ncbi:MAG: patatin-like phospholipase family protein [Candidatus Paceibacterota bacterium]
MFLKKGFSMSEIDLVFNLPGGISRLPLHVGAIKAYRDAGLPKPKRIIASSAGAMAGSAIIGWNDEALDKAIDIIGNLSPNDIFSFQRGLKVKLATLGIATVGLGVLILLDHKLSKSKKAAFGLSGLSALLIADALVGHELVHSASHLSPSPLKNLLSRELDFSSIFNSSIQLDVLVADMEKPGEVIFSNRHPLNSDLKNSAHRERWVNILLASSRLPGKFPFVKIDGIDTIDGEVWTDFPVRQMKEHQKAIRFDYWAPLQSEKAPQEWISDLSRSFDIMRDRCTQKKIENYQYERLANPSLPEIFYFRLNQDLLKQMPQVKIHNFTPADMKTLENIGYQAVQEQLPELRKYLETKTPR